MWVPEAEMQKLKDSWKPGQQWECKLPHESFFHDLPLGYQPGWFFDTEYRIKKNEQ